MSRSLIQTVNQSPQDVAEGGIIALGSVQRRYGCNLRLSGNGIEAEGAGYYDIDIAVTVEPSAVGAVTVAAYKDGAQIPGAIAYGYVATADEPVTLPIVATIRQNCCDGADNITCVLVENAGTVTNISTRIKKD